MDMFYSDELKSKCLILKSNMLSPFKPVSSTLTTGHRHWSAEPPQRLLCALDILFGSCCPNRVIISVEWSILSCSGLWRNDPIFLTSVCPAPPRWSVERRRLNDEWWSWVNCMWEEKKSTGVFHKPLLSRWVIFGRPPTRRHFTCQCGIQGIYLILPLPKCCNSNRWCLKVTQVRLLLADIQYKEISWSDGCIRGHQSLGDGEGSEFFNWTKHYSCWFQWLDSPLRFKLCRLETTASLKSGKRTPTHPLQMPAPW